jgi:hypothetical protein
MVTISTLTAVHRISSTANKIKMEMKQCDTFLSSTYIGDIYNWNIMKYCLDHKTQVDQKKN